MCEDQWKWYQFVNDSDSGKVLLACLSNSYIKHTIHLKYDDLKVTYFLMGSLMEKCQMGSSFDSLVELLAFFDWRKPGPSPDCDFALCCCLKGPESAVCFFGWTFNFGFDLFFRHDLRSCLWVPSSTNGGIWGPFLRETNCPHPGPKATKTPQGKSQVMAF